MLSLLQSCCEPHKMQSSGIENPHLELAPQLKNSKSHTPTSCQALLQESFHAPSSAPLSGNAFHLDRHFSFHQTVLTSYQCFILLFADSSGSVWNWEAPSQPCSSSNHPSLRHCAVCMSSSSLCKAHPECSASWE